MASRGFWDRFLDMLFGESAHPEVERPVLGAPMLSNWLPYRSYDKKSRMFVNTESLGFILECVQLGAGKRRQQTTGNKRKRCNVQFMANNHDASVNRCVHGSSVQYKAGEWRLKWCCL